MEKKNTGRMHALTRLGLAVLFVVVLLAVGISLTSVLRQKWNYTRDNAAQQIVRSYYLQPDDSIDVLLLGASTVRNGLSPLEMYHEYGFTSYSRATSIQLPVVSYYYLLETLASHDIKAVVLDSTVLTSVMYEDVDTLSGKLHEAVDYMPYSEYKLQMISEIAKMGLGISETEFLSPLYAYHDRWSELTKQDFSWESWDKNYYYKGQYPTLTTASYTYPNDYMEDDPNQVDINYSIVPDSADYVCKMIDLCKERGIEFIMIKTPVGSWSNYRHQLLQGFADENGVVFLDLCYSDMQRLINFDAKTDYCDDGKHPNITGAKKISSYLGAYLSKVCNFSEDKRQNPAYASWDSDYEKYEHLLEDVELTRDTNLITFMEKLDNDRYLTMIATRNDTARFFNEQLQEVFAGLGLKNDFADYTGLSYLAILDGKKLVYENSALGTEISYRTECEGHSISLYSHASQLTGNRANITMDDENVGTNSAGFNIVVYDKDVEQVIVKRAFPCGLNGKNYQKLSVLNTFHDDPLGYLDEAVSPGHITVIAVAKDAARFLPGSFNDKLINLGLKRISRELNTPYIAVLDGSKVVANVVGEQNGVSTAEVEIDGVTVRAVSSCAGTGAYGQITVGKNKTMFRSQGIGILVYDKESAAVLDTEEFATLTGLTDPVKFRKFTDLNYMLMAARQYDYDVICMFDPESRYTYSDETIEIMRQFGFTGLDTSLKYIGLFSSKGLLLEKTNQEYFDCSCYTQGNMLSLRIQEEQFSAIINGTDYSMHKGLYIIIFNPVEKAVYRAVTWPA